MNLDGFIIAERLENGQPGRPIGFTEDAVAIFEDFACAKKTREELQEQHGPLSVWKVNLQVKGEIITC